MWIGGNIEATPFCAAPVEALFQAARCIQEAIKAKEEEVAATDSACLQLCVPVKGSIFFQVYFSPRVESHLSESSAEFQILFHFIQCSGEMRDSPEFFTYCSSAAPPRSETGSQISDCARCV